MMISMAEDGKMQLDRNCHAEKIPPHQRLQDLLAIDERSSDNPAFAKEGHHVRCVARDIGLTGPVVARSLPAVLLPGTGNA